VESFGDIVGESEGEGEDNEFANTVDVKGEG
jgi:hypothetical protein